MPTASRTSAPPPARRRRWLTATAAALPLALAAAGLATAGPHGATTHGRQGAGVAGRQAQPAGRQLLAGRQLATVPVGSNWSGSTAGGQSLTLAQIRSVIGADTGAAAALTGEGVGVALVDTGVAPVPGLPAARIRNGPDLSFESQSASLRYLDTYGHGTAMAGIIVGDDAATGTRGLAPRARLTSVKVGSASGAVDVTQVIAAIDWVVQHRADDPAYPIRVLNLSYGTDAFPAVWTDPVHHAVEQAWAAGIVVVAAAGNYGNFAGRLTDPATDPYVISVGASSTKGTTGSDDDELSAFSSVSRRHRQVDVLAPGESVVSLRDPGSNIDTAFPGARVGTTLFRGSGTSQAAAVTSAAVALLLQGRPSLTPDGVKAVLEQGTPLKAGRGAALGMRQVDVATALGLPAGGAEQDWPGSSGTGSVEASRGTGHVFSNGVPLVGEASVFGPFDSAAWAARSTARTAWSGGLWMGSRAAGDGWTGTSFASKTWAAATWTAKPWGGGSSWTDPSWSGRYWTGRYWTGGAWTSRYWTSEDWSARYWSAGGWATLAGGTVSPMGRYWT